MSRKAITQLRYYPLRSSIISIIQGVTTKDHLLSNRVGSWTLRDWGRLQLLPANRKASSKDTTESAGAKADPPARIRRGCTRPAQELESSVGDSWSTLVNPWHDVYVKDWRKLGIAFHLLFWWLEFRFVHARRTTRVIAQFQRQNSRLSIKIAPPLRGKGLEQHAHMGLYEVRGKNKPG